MSNLPIRRAQFDVPNFAAWLAKNGAEIGTPTNPYEVIRYLAHDGGRKATTHIVYAKESGLLTWCGKSQDHYFNFITGARIWPEQKVGKATRPAKPDTASKPERRRQKLLARDGDECWFCGKPMGEDCTIEHLVPKSAGGRDTLANYALAHRRCNNDAADMPLVEKIEMRTRLRSQVAA